MFTGHKSGRHWQRRGFSSVFRNQVIRKQYKRTENVKTTIETGINCQILPPYYRIIPQSWHPNSSPNSLSVHNILHKILHHTSLYMAHTTKSNKCQMLVNCDSIGSKEICKSDWTKKAETQK